MRGLILLLFVCGFYAMNAQEQKMEEKYFEIPPAPETYESGDMLSRTIDGLGYRYYWATKDLTDDDLAYAPSHDSRSAYETLEHMHGLSNFIVSVARQDKITRSPKEDMSWAEMRQKTIDNIYEASQLFRGLNAETLSTYNIVFDRGENSSELPLWNLLNGPIADAIYHTGQIVAYRRASGNPLHPGVSVFRGKTNLDKTRQ